MILILAIDDLGVKYFILSFFLLMHYSIQYVFLVFQTSTAIALFFVSHDRLISLITVLTAYPLISLQRFFVRQQSFIVRVSFVFVSQSVESPSYVFCLPSQSRHNRLDGLSVVDYAELPARLLPLPCGAQPEDVAAAACGVAR